MKDKALKIVAAVLAVLTVASVVAFFATRNREVNNAKPQNYVQKGESIVYSYADSDYTKSLTCAGTNGEIFMPADFDGVFYTADLKGNVAFYEYADSVFTKSGMPVKQVKVTLAATYEKIPVTVNYIEKDGKTFGIGVFTSDMDSSVDVYAYAFVKLINKPSGYGTGHLLLADFEKENFYNTDKIYSEIYNFDLKSGKASTYVSNNTRLLDKNGAFRNDWTMLTDDFIANLGGAKYFLSSRYYTAEERGKRADIMVLSNAYRPEIVAEDILGTWFVNDADGMHYLRKTAKGFNSVYSVAKKETVLREFEGDYFADYLHDGKWLINKKSLAVTDLMTGATQTLNDINIAECDAVSVSPDGTRFVFTKNGIKNDNGVEVQQLIYASVKGEPAKFAEPLLFEEGTGFVWLDNGYVMSVRATSADGKAAGSMLYSFFKD